MIFRIRQILTYACLTLFTSILSGQADQYFSLLNQDSLLKKLQVKSITFYDTSSPDLKYTYDIKGRLRKVLRYYIDGPDTSYGSTTYYYTKTRLVKTMSLGEYHEMDIIDTVFTTYYYYKDSRLRKMISTRSFSNRIDTSAYTYFLSAGMLIWRKNEYNDNSGCIDSFKYYEGGNLLWEITTYPLIEELIDENGKVFYQERWEWITVVNGEAYNIERIHFIYSNNRLSQIINTWINSESGEESTPETWSFFYNDLGLVFKIERERVWKKDDELKKETTQYFLRYEFY